MLAMMVTTLTIPLSKARTILSSVSLFHILLTTISITTTASGNFFFMKPSSWCLPFVPTHVDHLDHHLLAGYHDLPFYAVPSSRIYETQNAQTFDTLQPMYVHPLGKLATHDVLKTTHLTKTAPIFTFSLPCNCVLSNCAYFAFLPP
jgi:hypothetical protein